MKPSGYEHLPAAKGVLVCFYGDIHPMFISSADLPLSVEDICEKSAQYLHKYLPQRRDSDSPDDSVCLMSSLTLPIFSLIDTDHKIWMSSREKLNNQECVYRFFFRIRFCIFSCNLTLLRKLDSQTWEYLFLQLQDDFLNDRLNKELERSKLLGFVVVAYFIPQLADNQQQEQDKVTEPSVTFFGLKKHLPAKERLNFKWPWPYFRLYRSVKEEVTKYSRSLGSNGVVKFKHTYMNGILEEVGNYGSEVYPATELRYTENGIQKDEVDVIVDPFFSRPAGIYFGMMFVCQFQDVQNIALHTSTHQEFGGKVQIVRKNGAPKEICFKESKMAESFVSCVDGYCRLLCNFYYSLSTPVMVEPPSLTLLKQLRAFGPMLRQDAETELLKEMSVHKEEDVSQRSAYFLIHQSVHSLSEFVIVQLADQNDTVTHTKLFYDRTKTSFRACLEDVGEVDCSGAELLLQLRKKAHMIRPNCTCSLSELFQSDDMSYYYERHSAENNVSKSTEPRLFQENAIDSTKCVVIGKGMFTRVSVVELLNQPGREDVDIKVAVKQLNPGNMSYAEDFQDGMWKLMKLQSSKTFVRLYGYMFKAPFRALLEHAPLGDLQHVITKCSHPLNLMQVMSVVEQITHGLTAMEEKKELHGNLRCRNILVVQIRSNDLLVKISDPGLETLYNTKNLTDAINIERLAWIAVERFDNLKKVTMSSEIYAFASTCWEMLSGGIHPGDAIKELPAQDQIAFYRQGKRPPRPVGLELTLDDPAKTSKDTMWQLVEDCWASDPENRPSIKDISKTVFSLCDMVREEVEVENNEEFWEKTRMEIQQGRLVTVNPLGDKNSTSTNIFFHEKTVINKDQLEIDTSDSGKLGEGYYGQVRKGKLYEASRKVDQRSTKPPQIVAVKQLKKIDANQKLDFMKEIDIASALSHENIVKVLGVCWLPEERLVMEYVERGSVINYLKSLNRDPPPSRLARFCLDVAEGMKYLHSNKVVHRDLAARNVLLSKELKAKITDFGLAKILTEKDYYRGITNKEIPAHWCAPEAITHRRFSKKGDVWSYGVLLWEIFNLGKKKPHLVPTENLGMLSNKLQCGSRLPEPSHCPCAEFYSLMKNDCWQYEADNRADFDLILRKVFELSRSVEEK